MALPGLFALVGPFFKGTIGSFFVNFGANYLLDKGEDGMRELVEKINWNNVSQISQRSKAIRFVYGFLANVLDGAKRAGITSSQLAEVVTWLTSGIEAAVQSRLSGTAKHIVTEVVDESGDLLRQKLRDGNLSSTIHWLRKVASGEISPGDDMSDTEGSSEGQTPSRASRIKKVTFKPWQRKSLELWDLIVEIHSIRDDTLEIPDPSNLSRQLNEVLATNPEVLNSLPKMSDKWHKQARKRLSQLRQAYVRGHVVIDGRERGPKYFERKVEDLYWTKFSSFNRHVASLNEGTDNKFIDGAQAAVALVSDLMNRHFTREGRMRWRERLGVIGGWIVEHAPGGILGYARFLTFVIASAAVLNIGGLLTLLAYMLHPVAGGVSLMISIIAALSVSFVTLGALPAPRHFRSLRSVLGYAARHAALFFVPVLLWLLPAVFGVPGGFPVYLAGVCLMGSLGGFVWYELLVPLDGLMEAFRGHQNPTTPGIFGRLFRALGRNEDLAALAVPREPLEKREMSPLTHLTSLIDIIFGFITWVVGSLITANMSGFSPVASFVCAVFGLIGAIFIGTEGFRRNRLLYYYKEITKEAGTRQIDRFRHFATSAFGTIAMVAIVEVVWTGAWVLRPDIMGEFSYVMWRYSYILRWAGLFSMFSPFLFVPLMAWAGKSGRAILRASALSFGVGVLLLTVSQITSSGLDPVAQEIKLEREAFGRGRFGP